MLIRAIVAVHYTVPTLDVGPHNVPMEPASLEKWKTRGFDPIGSTPKVSAERQRPTLPTLEVA